VVQKDVASTSTDISNTVSRLVTHLDKVSVGLLSKLLDASLHCFVKLRKVLQINFSQHNNEWFSLEKWLDVVEKRNLLLDGVSTSFRNIEQKQNTCVQMCQSCDGLHFNCVSLVKRMIKDTWGINNLPSRILVVSVSNEKTLSGECIGLNVNVSISHVVNKR